MQETHVWSPSWEDPLEKGMATHSSILAGEFHRQRSLVGYSPGGRKRVGHEWVTNTGLWRWELGKAADELWGDRTDNGYLKLDRKF